MNRGKGYICPECGKLHVRYLSKSECWECPACNYKGKDFEKDDEYESWVYEEGAPESSADECNYYTPNKRFYIEGYGIPRNPEFRKKWMEEIEEDN